MRHIACLQSPLFHFRSIAVLCAHPQTPGTLSYSDVLYLFQVTPLAIAIMKDQMPCADYLLSLDNVDVNFPDDCGRTLLCQKLRCSPLNNMLVEKATYLVEKKGADVNKADVEQWTPVNIMFIKKKIHNSDFIYSFLFLLKRQVLFCPAATLSGSKLCL